MTGFEIIVMIYFIGVASAMAISSYSFYKLGRITISDVFLILIASIASWLGFCIHLCSCFGDVVLWKRKENRKKFHVRY